MIARSATNDERRGLLNTLLREKSCLRVVEVHNPISAIVAENACVIGEDGSPLEVDAFWSSSLADSISRGLPDIEILPTKVRLANIDDVFSVTSKPLIMDGDTGGPKEHFELAVRDIERHGVSAVVIEDKSGLKQNSLLGVSDRQRLADLDEFCVKIRCGKAAQVTGDLRIIARLESLILGYGLQHALERADAYVAAGADGVMIHSRKSDGREVLDFADAFRERHPDVVLVAVPTTYYTLHFNDLAHAGFNVIIYANHMLRAALKAMEDVCNTILAHGRASEAEAVCADLADVLHVKRLPALATTPRRPADVAGASVPTSAAPGAASTRPGL